MPFSQAVLRVNALPNFIPHFWLWEIKGGCILWSGDQMLEV